MGAETEHKSDNLSATNKSSTMILPPGVTLGAN